jgi:uncharacterized protein YqfA (UPF0365 family)
MGGDTFILLFAFLAVAVFGLLVLTFFAAIARPWIRAAASGAPISIFSILGMRLRGSSPTLVIDAYIALKRAGVAADIYVVEGTYIDHRTRIRSRDDLIELVKNAAADKEVNR